MASGVGGYKFYIRFLKKILEKLRKQANALGKTIPHQAQSECKGSERRTHLKSSRNRIEANVLEQQA